MTDATPAPGAAVPGCGSCPRRADWQVTWTGPGGRVEQHACATHVAGILSGIGRGLAITVRGHG